MSAVYTDSNFDGLKVGSELIKLSEAERYVTQNYQAMRKRLERSLGYAPQWKQDMQAKGVQFADPEINETLRPLPFTVSRIVTEVSGYQRITLTRQKDERSPAENITVTISDLNGAFSMLSVDEWLNGRLQWTVDDIKQRIADETKLERQQQEAKTVEELKQAKAVIAKHKDLPKAVREAVELDIYEMATVRNAISVIKNAATMAK